jgi:ABC-type transport system involved in cytochrome c biogenesis permease component
MSYLTLLALMLLVVSPVLIPLVITGVHAIDSLLAD